MGFYWDDWPFIWFSHVLNPASLIQIEIHRPLSGVVFALGAFLLGENPLAWQGLMFVTRWLSGVGLIWTLQKLWPKHAAQILWVVLFFLVYPGFRQQYVAVNTSRHLIPLVLYLLSLGYMIAAIKKPEHAWRFTGLALLFALIQLLTTEYYFGAELLRPVILWVALEPAPFSLKKIGLAWLPYLTLLVAFFIWRLFIFNVGYYPINLLATLKVAPVLALTHLADLIPQDLVEVSLGAWRQVFQFPSSLEYGLRPVLYYWVVVILAGVGLLIFLSRLPHPARATQTRWVWQACVIGGVALLCGGWPFWAIDELTIKLSLPWDRLTLPMALGVSLLMAGLVEGVGQNRYVKITLVTVLVSLAVGFQFLNALEFRRDWQLQKEFFHQLTWRIPALQPNTLLLNNQLPSLSTDNSLTAAFNWIYTPALNPGDPLPYMLINADLRLGGSLGTLEPGVTLEKYYRVFPYSGSTSQAIVIYFAPPACLRVLDPLIDAQNPHLPEVYRQALPLSQTQNILPTPPHPATPPVHLFGEPATGTWCYFYEKADLARQTGAWETLLALSASAPFNTLQTQNAAELIPFIEAFARTGAWAKALQLSQQALQLDPLLHPMICDHWARLANDLTHPPEIVALQAELTCPAPTP